MSNVEVTRSREAPRAVARFPTRSGAATSRTPSRARARAASTEASSGFGTVPKCRFRPRVDPMPSRLRAPGWRAARGRATSTTSSRPIWWSTTRTTTPPERRVRRSVVCTGCSSIRRTSTSPRTCSRPVEASSGSSTAAPRKLSRCSARRARRRGARITCRSGTRTEARSSSRTSTARSSSGST